MKLGESLPDHRSKVDGYQFRPFRKDWDKNGGGKVVFVKEGLIVSRIKEFETSKSEKMFRTNHFQ